MQQSASRTAEAVCFFRASEQWRPQGDRILDDPLAKSFLSPTFRAALKVSDGLKQRAWNLSLGLTAFVLIRHRWMDDALVEAVSGGRAHQVLILGAGYDTRAWRHVQVLGDLPVYEVDHPVTQARKVQLSAQLPALPHMKRIPVDFQTQDLGQRLVEDGFTEGAPTFVIWEGVSMYLTRAAVEHTLSTLAKLVGPGSQLVMDYIELPDYLGWRGTFDRISPQILHLVGEPVSFAIHPDDLGGFVGRQGWDLEETQTADQLGERYLRMKRRVFSSSYVSRLQLS
ncbi:MAG: SAM-dependent methyltransferase [Rhodobacterales bacterium]|nr:SAM-dependent methyltransferase [Rhodobacterales bacterium]